MRSAFFSLLILSCALMARGQTNPHTQIRWPSPSCSTAGKVYDFSSNTCIGLGSMNGQVAPSTQINWPGSCTTAGTVYSLQSNTCVALDGMSGKVAPSTQINWPGSCTTAGTVYSLQSNSCVAIAGVTWRGAWSAGTYTINDMVSNSGNTYISTATGNTATPPSSPWALVAQAGATGPVGPPASLASPGPIGNTTPSTGFFTQVQANGQTLGGKPSGVHFFGDSITAYNGSTSTWSGFAQQSLAYATRLGSLFGGVFTNDAVGGNQVLDQAVIMSQTIIPQLNGQINSLMINTNDAGLYAGNVDKQTVTKRIDTFTHNYLAIPSSSYKTAQSCTATGTWTNDDTYGIGRGISSTTNGNTLSCSTTPPAGSPGVVLACYIIADAWTTSTFTLSIDGTPQADPFESGTTWHGNGDNGALISSNGGRTAGPVCARFSGLSTGSAHTFLWTVTGTTGATAKVEPLMLMTVPAPSPNNPPATIFGFPIPNSSTTNYTYNAVYYAITQTIAQRAASDGLNVTWIDTQAAEAANQTVTVPIASSTTTVTPGNTSGWVSDVGVSYYQTAAALTKVSSAPACGQYAVTAGTYTLNACDLGKPLTYSFVANCGAGTSNAVYAANCLTDTLHPSNLGHAVIIAAAQTAAPLLLTPGALQDQTAWLAQTQTPKEWVTDNPNGLNNTTSWNPGRAWIKSFGNIWGTSFSPTWGVIQVAPSSVPHTAWCTYPSTIIPKDMTTLSCPVFFNAGGFYAGYVSSGHSSMYADTSNFYIGLGGQGVGTAFVPVTFKPITNATLSVNQPSPALSFTGFTWYSTGSASATDTYSLINTTANGSQNTHLKLTHSLNACASAPCTWDFDVSGATGVNALGNASVTTLATSTVCSSTASPAVCGAAVAGKVQVAAAATSLVINSTAITANTGCWFTYNVEGITPPANVASLIAPYISARTAGTSLTITVPVAPTTNPVNIQFGCIN